MQTAVPTASIESASPRIFSLEISRKKAFWTLWNFGPILFFPEIPCSIPQPVAAGSCDPVGASTKAKAHNS